MAYRDSTLNFEAGNLLNKEILYKSATPVKFIKDHKPGSKNTINKKRSPAFPPHPGR